MAEPTRSRKYIAGAWTLLGDCAVAKLDWEAGEKWYLKANALVRSIGHAPQTWQTHAALGQLYGDTGRAGQSRQHYQAAREGMERLRKTTKTKALRAGLEHAPRVRQVLERAKENQK